jgi:hypothetical protein
MRTEEASGSPYHRIGIPPSEFGCTIHNGMGYSLLGFCGLFASFAPSGSSVGSSAKLDEREDKPKSSVEPVQSIFFQGVVTS